MDDQTEPWQTTLGDILSGYFTDYDFDTGVNEMAGVTARSDDYHRSYLEALDQGIAAAARGDGRIVPLVVDSFAKWVADPAEARAYLERIRAAYLRRREQLR
jgi:hypothetical protein